MKKITALFVSLISLSLAANEQNLNHPKLISITCDAQLTKTVRYLVSININDPWLPQNPNTMGVYVIADILDWNDGHLVSNMKLESYEGELQKLEESSSLIKASAVVKSHLDPSLDLNFTIDVSKNPRGEDSYRGTFSGDNGEISNRLSCSKIYLEE